MSDATIGDRVAALRVRLAHSDAGKDVVAHLSATGSLDTDARLSPVWDQSWPQNWPQTWQQAWSDPEEA
jgi:hypothetical protein